jgi:hypothetical protein
VAAQRRVPARHRADGSHVRSLLLFGDRQCLVAAKRADVINRLLEPIRVVPADEQHSP